MGNGMIREIDLHDSLNARLDEINSTLVDLDNNLYDATAIIPTVAYGMNNVIKNDGEVSVSPKFTITGKDYINRLGKDGNCEDVSKWTLINATTSLDSNNKVFGTNSIKMVATSTGVAISKTKASLNLDNSKYYLVSAYLKNGNTNNGVRILGQGTTVQSSYITNTTSFVRVGIVLSPSDMALLTELWVYSGGTTVGQFGWVDGIMVNEITSAEYALGTTALLANYPYVDSYSCLQNPYIEVRHDNLVRNGNTEVGTGYWNLIGSGVTFSIVNNKFQVTSASGLNGEVQLINVKPNTDYYLAGNTSGTMVLRVYDGTNTTLLRNGVGTFNTGVNSVIQLWMVANTGTGTADSIHLVEGTTAPTSYKSCRIERTVIEGKFTSDDSFVYDNGEVSGLINWKHKVLFGKDYDWQFDGDGAGYKQLSIQNAMLGVLSGITTTVKYNGNVIKGWQASVTTGDHLWVNGAGSIVYLTINDSDTGWTESLNPNADESKVNMNGWKAIYNNGTRYCAWVSIVDGSIPSGAIQSVVSSSTSTTTTVADGTKFAVNDVIAVITSTGALKSVQTITAIVGNVITCGNTTGVSSDIMIKIDNGTTNVSLLTWCKNNVAPGYDGYQLHYKLANPEPITDINTHVHGDVPIIDIGDNYVYVDSGMVIGEVANPVNDGTNIQLNKLSDGFYASSAFKNKVEVINAIYKNLIDNSNAWSTMNNTGSNYTNGKERKYMGATSGFDTSATYTVDYKILATQAPQIGTITCSYTQDIAGEIDNLKEAVASRQVGDSALDTLVDLSVYEKIAINGAMGTLTPLSTGSSYFVFNIPFTNKKVSPMLTINITSIICLGGYSIPLPSLGSPAIKYVGTGCVQIFLSTIDVTAIGKGNTIAQLFGTITADCRGRI